MNSPIWKLIEDLSKKSGITEVMINSAKSIFVEKLGQTYNLNANFQDQDLFDFVEEFKIYNKISTSDLSTLIDGRLNDGSRVNIVMPPFSGKTPVVTIRKHQAQSLLLSSHLDFFHLNISDYEFLLALIKARTNVIISGGTGTGKTTFLNSLLNEISPKERLITIEDTCELKLQQHNLVSLEAANHFKDKISIRDLVKNSLRMRPDRIIVGEARGAEMFDLLMAMNTGHSGSMTTLHANSALESLSRIETLLLLSGYDYPIFALRKIISESIDFIIHLHRNENGEKRISEIIEVCGMEGQVILTSTIYTTDESGHFIKTGQVPHKIKKLNEIGQLDRAFFK